MNDEMYQQWKEHRSRVSVPDGFADRVMEGIGRSRQERSMDTGVRVLLSALLSRRFVRAAILILGTLGGLVRLGSVLAFILGSCLEAKGGLPW